MTTTTTTGHAPRTAAHGPSRMAVPPPDLVLFDGDRAVGWIREATIGFGGFRSDVEAAHAAWVAGRALARRLARTHGDRHVPVDPTRIALDRRRAPAVVLAEGRPIATLVSPGDGSPGAPHAGLPGDSAAAAGMFGFEVRVPAPADVLRLRGLAHLMYRALRATGVPWAMWADDETAILSALGARGAVPEVSSPETLPVAGSASARRRRAWAGLTTGFATAVAGVALLVLAFGLPRPPSVVGMLGIGALVLAGLFGMLFAAAYAGWLDDTRPTSGPAHAAPAGERAGERAAPPGPAATAAGAC